MVILFLLTILENIYTFNFTCSCFITITNVAFKTIKNAED